MSGIPRFSIVMPAYNTERFIGEAIDSVIAQTEPDWELIVVDDGSTDATAAVVAGIEDGRIRMMKQPNAGVSAARNTGMESAGGRFVLFLDSDDRMRPDALRRLGAAQDASPDICVAYGDWVFVDEGGRVIGAETKPRFMPRPSGMILEPMLRNGFLLQVGTACIRADCLRRVGDWAPYRLGEDWEYMCRLAAHGDFQYVGEGPVLEYRLHGKSTVRRIGRNIEELSRVIDAVFANPIFRDRLPERTLTRLKRKRQAATCAFGAKHCIAGGQWGRALILGLRGIWLDLLNPADLILPGIIAQTVERRSRRRRA